MEISKTSICCCKCIHTSSGLPGDVDHYTVVPPAAMSTSWTSLLSTHTHFSHLADALIQSDYVVVVPCGIWTSNPGVASTVLYQRSHTGHTQLYPGGTMLTDIVNVWRVADRGEEEGWDEGRRWVEAVFLIVGKWENSEWFVIRMAGMGRVAKKSIREGWLRVNSKEGAVILTAQCKQLSN